MDGLAEVGASVKVPVDELGFAFWHLCGGGASVSHSIGRGCLFCEGWIDSFLYAKTTDDPGCMTSDCEG